MLVYSIIFPIISILAIGIFYKRFKNGKNSLSSFIVWTILWIFIFVFSIVPDASSIFARFFGISRGLDFIIILAFAILFYIIGKLYFIIEDMQNDMNKIVKEVALNNEITLEDEEE